MSAVIYDYQRDSSQPNMCKPDIGYTLSLSRRLSHGLIMVPIHVFDWQDILVCHQGPSTLLRYIKLDIVLDIMLFKLSLCACHGYLVMIRPMKIKIMDCNDMLRRSLSLHYTVYDLAAFNGN